MFDTAGADVLADSVALTGDEARVVTIANPRAGQHAVRWTGGDAADRRFDAYPMLAELLAAKKLTVRIGRTYRLHEVQQTHEDLDLGRHGGKLILTSTGSSWPAACDQQSREEYVDGPLCQGGRAGGFWRIDQADLGYQRPEA